MDKQSEPAQQASWRIDFLTELSAQVGLDLPVKALRGLPSAAAMSPNQLFDRVRLLLEQGDLELTTCNGEYLLALARGPAAEAPLRDDQVLGAHKVHALAALIAEACSCGSRTRTSPLVQEASERPSRPAIQATTATLSARPASVESSHRVAHGRSKGQAAGASLALAALTLVSGCIQMPGQTIPHSEMSLPPSVMIVPEMSPEPGDPAPSVVPAPSAPAAAIAELPPRSRLPSRFEVLEDSAGTRADTESEIRAVLGAGGSCSVAIYRIAWSEARRSHINPAALAALIDIESRCQPAVTSRAGARGIMQLMPRYGGRVGLRLTTGANRRASPRELTDPATNIRLGVAYLSWLSTQFSSVQSQPGRLLLALAAYHCGPETIAYTLPAESQYWSPEQVSDWIDVTAPRPTRAYVQHIVKTAFRYHQAIRGLEAKPIADS